MGGGEGIAGNRSRIEINNNGDEIENLIDDAINASTVISSYFPFLVSFPPPSPAHHPPPLTF